MPHASPKKQELYLESYKIVVSMLQNEDILFWRRSEVLIALNAGMLTVIGFIQSAQVTAATESSKVISVAICGVGTLICMLWLLIAKRSEAFYNHWYEQLKFLEKQYLRPIRIFQIADEFFSKGNIDLGDDHFSLDILSRSLHMSVAMQVVAGIFSFVWVGLGIFLLFHI